MPPNDPYNLEASTLHLFFIYSHPELTVGANATVTTTIPILADAEFACYYVTGQVVQANLLVANWAGTLQVDDSGVGRTWFDRQIRVDSIFGDARQPYPMAIPRRVARNSTLVITYVNPVATVTVVQMQLHGYKLYAGEGATAPSR